ncbi:tail fiber protein [uncultured Tateyamaria sp.]|uniref:phage tail protein n=1 Tax=Tateyamaria sp. 1078 TaxID=3417464 RepID=UPI00262BBC3C|nr:tail fiber protein [uncultured Tateyamaria sp.]
MKHILSTIAAAALAASIAPAPVAAGANPFIGTIQTFGENFCPRGWAPANGQLLQISSHTALFSLIGTIYGGDGRTTMGLPNLNGRGSVGYGNGPGLSTRTMGQVGGATTTTMNVTTMANHTHSVTGDIRGNTVASAAAPSTTDPANAYYSTFPSGTSIYADASTPPVEMGDGSVEFESSAAISNSGGALSATNEQPFLAMTVCIALEGIYPSRS